MQQFAMRVTLTRIFVSYQFTYLHINIQQQLKVVYCNRKNTIANVKPVNIQCYTTHHILSRDN